MTIDDAITLKKLEVFLAFMELGNMARVSELLGQSVVSVHRALHSLEESLHCPLFKREGRNLVPLKSAFIFVEHARRSVAECAEGVRKVREASGFNASRMKIGSLYSLTLRCMPQLMIGLKSRRPELDLDLTLGSNKELLKSLAEGQLDAIVIGLHRDNDNSALVSVPLFYDDVFLAAPLASPYASHAKIDLQQIKEEKFVTLTEGYATSEDFEYCFQKAGFRPSIVMRVKDIFSLINLISAGMGYSLLPGRIAEFSHRIELIPLQEQYATRQMITLLILKSRERDPNLLALAAECRMAGRGSAIQAGTPTRSG
jgi:LysR family malonate utilization transcriptional regulator